MTDPAKQSVISGYRVIKQLGHGGMGTVYLVENPVLPRREALKVLSPELSLDDQFRARFIREADVAARLNHPNIVSVYTRGETATGQLWIAMEFVDGLDADAALDAGAMMPHRAVRIVAEVAKALDHAHRYGVVHRDVKPANFLVANGPPNDERVLLADFGIARALDDFGLTATGSIMATLAFAAPEVLGSAGFDARADIYSLGCSLYRLLTGSLPFSETAGLAGLVVAHLTQQPPLVTARAPWLPAALDAVVTRAMAKDPRARFQTAGELAVAAADAIARPQQADVSRRALPDAQVSFHAQVPSRRQSAPTAPTPDVSWRPPTAQPPGGRAPRSRARWVVPSSAAVVILAGGAIAAFTLTGPGDRGAAAPSSSPIATPTTPMTASGPPAGPPAPSILPAAVLLPPDTLAAIVASPGLRVTADESTLLNDAADIDTPDCISAWMPAQQLAYDGSNWSSAAVQTVQQPPRPLSKTGVIQAVVAFPSAQVAQKYVDDQNPRWLACAQRSVTVTPSDHSDPPQTWTFGVTRRANGVATIDYRQGGEGPICQRALTARDNVAVDVLACVSDLHVQNTADTIAENIAAKAG